MIYFLVPATFALMQIPLDVNVDGKITLKEGVEEVKFENGSEEESGLPKEGDQEASKAKETCGARKYLAHKKVTCEAKNKCYWTEAKYFGGKCRDKKEKDKECEVDEECLSALCVKETAEAPKGTCDGASFDHHAVTEWIHKTSAKELVAETLKKSESKCSEYERLVRNVDDDILGLTHVDVSLLRNKDKKIAIFSFKVETQAQTQLGNLQQFYQTHLSEWVQKQIDSFIKNNEDGPYKITMTGKGRGALVALAARQDLEGKVGPQDAYLMMYDLPDLPEQDAVPAQDTNFCKTTRIYPRMTRKNICPDKKEGKNRRQKAIMVGKLAVIASSTPFLIPLVRHSEKKRLRKEIRGNKVFDFFACD